MRRILALLLLLPSLLAAAPSTRPTMDDQCRDLLATWQPRFKEDAFSATISAPFVIAGDMSPRDVQLWRDQSVRPAAQAFAAAFFKTPPDRPILILLFADEKSYRSHAKRWFDDTDVSYYGYFRHDRVMLMNIATGGGTLVHEMVHALLRPDFPACPDWVNEGMGSLYEQCSIHPLKGLPNWRLPALQDAITKKELRSLQDLIEDEDFYAKPNVGINYAQARYLLLYLQRQNLLTTFYTKLRDNHATDPTGLKTLQATIAPQKLADFEPTWRAWVLGLHFPDR